MAFHAQVVSGCSTWSVSTPYQSSSRFYLTRTRKWNRQFLLCTDPVIPQARSRPLKWFKMVEVNDVHEHARYETYWSKSLRIMSNVKVFAIRDSWSDGRTQLIYIYPYANDMNQKWDVFYHSPWTNNSSVNDTLPVTCHETTIAVWMTRFLSLAMNQQKQCEWHALCHLPWNNNSSVNDTLSVTCHKQ